MIATALACFAAVALTRLAISPDRPEGVTMRTPGHPHPDCGTCNAYLARRIDVIPAAVVRYAPRRGMEPGELLIEFVRGVHKRHLAGLSLATDGSA